MFNEFQFPLPPEIAPENLERCRATGDYTGILFEWYKYVGLVCNLIACGQRFSPAIRNIEPIHYHVLVGLLNRCSRLMLANVALSHDGTFGETTSIIDRCITESAIKVMWLCKTSAPDRFTRLIADGLKTELELEAKIRAIIQARNGNVLRIEDRMLCSIENHIVSSGLSRNDIATAKRIPDMASMIDHIGGDRLMYIIVEKIGSHHIHGTWPSLRLHYLRDHEGELAPTDHDCPTHMNQYLIVSMLVLMALRAFIEFVIRSPEDIAFFTNRFDAIQEEIQHINAESLGNDFENMEI
jgi:hypothetical protein